MEAVFFTTAPRLSSCKSCCILSHLRPQGGKEQREREERRACLEKTWEVEERKEEGNTVEGVRMETEAGAEDTVQVRIRHCQPVLPHRGFPWESLRLPLLDVSGHQERYPSLETPPGSPFPLEHSCSLPSGRIEQKESWSVSSLL